MEKQISVTGIVNGVGFQPFVSGLANRFNLHGWVRNTSAGVEIIVQGQNTRVKQFIARLKAEAPLLTRIDSIAVQNVYSHVEYMTFDIQPSPADPVADQAIVPDYAICPDCARELFDPQDRRYLYPFINCANCGPRFTILKDSADDPPGTSMTNLEMCADCRAEYENPSSRRFRVQSVACPECGPFVELRETRTRSPNLESKISTIECRISAILKARRLLRQGSILAVKGTGGFHLACDASNAHAVNELRRRTGRAEKPLVVLAADLETAQSICKVNDVERNLLTGRERPVVLLMRKRRTAATVCNQVMPNLDTLGVMLPYSPLHHLLLNQTDSILMKEPAPPVLVMMSGNFGEEPIAIDNVEALQKLEPFADAFLLHDDDIYVRCDVSVTRVDQGRTLFLRRSCGFAPQPIQMPFPVEPTLAVGGDLRNVFCLARDRSAFLSQQVGNLSNAETRESFERTVQHLSRLFRIQPALIAHDLHPDYFTTQYARHSTPAVRHIGVQHHHAHIAACMADNSLEDRQVIGLAFDGAGYGPDGAIWGGDVLLASYADFNRLAHLEYLPLPGRDPATYHPWRIALAYAHALGLEIDDLQFLQKLEKDTLQAVKAQLDQNLNVPRTSSVRHLFDAVAGLIGIRHEETYEAQAALELEVLARPFATMVKSYPFFIEEGQDGLIVQLQGLLAAVVKGLRSNESAEMVAARFHRTVADIAIGLCKYARTRTSLNEVALSGDIWQNQILLDLVRAGLDYEGFTIYFHHQVPANDGGLALGQAVVAHHVMASLREAISR
jgi:hydrogenase maturation protein HypF